MGEMADWIIDSFLEGEIWRPTPIPRSNDFEEETFEDEETQMSEISNRKILGQMNQDQYDQVVGLTQSELSYLLKSPLHFQQRETLWRESDAMRLGTAIHAAILEPGTFKDRLALEPETVAAVLDSKDRVVRASNVGPGELVHVGPGERVEVQQINRRIAAHRKCLEAWADACKAQGRVIVKQSEYDVLTGILAQVGNTPELNTLLRGGTPEAVATWQVGTRQCKGKADYIVQHPTFGKCIVDIKTTQDGSPSAFSRSCFNYAYDLQAGWYADGFGADSVIFVVCEKSAPYTVAIYRADDSFVDRGRSLYRRLLERLSQCEQANRWPGYTDGVGTLLLPAWVSAQDDSGEHEI